MVAENNKNIILLNRIIFGSHYHTEQGFHLNRLGKEKVVKTGSRTIMMSKLFYATNHRFSFLVTSQRTRIQSHPAHPPTIGHLTIGNHYPYQLSHLMDSLTPDLNID